jgi:hypothetical protein
MNMHWAPTRLMTVIPRLSASGSILAPTQAGQRRQLLAAISDLQRSVWLLECNLKPTDQLALLDSLETTADQIDHLLS